MGGRSIEFIFYMLGIIELFNLAFKESLTMYCYDRMSPCFLEPCIIVLSKNDARKKSGTKHVLAVST